MKRCVLSKRSVDVLKNKALAAILGMSTLLATHTYAQLSGYSSLSYGYHGNPLYNYQQSPDQLRQIYLELNSLSEYEKSTLNLVYTGGLMTFNRFQERDYYEHKLRTNYTISLSEGNNFSFRPDTIVSLDDPDSTTTSATAPENAENKVDEVGTAANGVFSHDTTDDILSFDFFIDARHDREIFKEFDNLGADFSPSFRTLLSGGFICRLSSQLAYRDFIYLPDLSSIRGNLTTHLELRSPQGFSFGVSVAGGLKYYTQTQYDTTRFEQTRSFVPNPQGKGKPGAILIPSDKRILIEPATNGTVQISGTLSIGYSGIQTTIQSAISMRRNVRSSTRYLAQTSNSSLLERDIYNDAYNSEGLKASFFFRQNVTKRVQLIIHGESEKRNYGVPALNLLGEQIDPHRSDIQSTLDVYLSYTISLFAGTDLELFLNPSWARNQSNDEYNDFSFFSISGGLGISF